MKVQGQVVDQNGDPLPLTNILEKGTTNGTQADFDGNFSLSVTDENAVLVFSFIGYTSQEVNVNGQTSLSVQLEESERGLDEVVVVGYGEQKKEHLTSSVATVDEEDLENRPVRSVAEMLTASVPNLNIGVSGNAPDDNPSLNIRGFTGFNFTGNANSGPQAAEPLVLVDGVAQDIRYVNPYDVANISVLKDASAAAIYGNRGANGVILITTKSGKKGERLSVNFSADFQLSKPTGIPDQYDSYQRALISQEFLTNSNGVLMSDTQLELIRQYVEGEIDYKNEIGPNGKYIKVSGYHANEDIGAAAFRDNILNQRYNLSVGGGTEKSSFYFSFGNDKRDGIYNSEVDYVIRNTASIKASTDITDWLTIGVNSRYTKEKTVRPQIWNTGGDGVNNQNDGSIFENIFDANHFPIKEDNGSYNEFSLIPSIKGLAGTYDNDINEVFNKANVEIRPLEGLKITADYGLRFNQRSADRTQFAFMGLDADGTPVDSRRNPDQDAVTKSTQNTTYSVMNLSASYTRKFGDHEFLLLAGYNEEEQRYEELYGFRSDFYTTSVPSLSGAFGDNIVVDDEIRTWANVGVFSRLNYNYKGKYLLEMNSRYDASSRFAPEDRWAFFPAVSAGYNIHEEKFWPLQGIVDRLKITGNWGEQGDPARSGLYPYISTIGTNSQIGTLIGGTRPPSASQPSLIPQNLTWVRVRNIGFGGEIAFFGNRLQAEYQWYQRTSYDQVGPATTLPEVLGIEPPRTNNTVSETRGWEVMVRWNDDLFNVGGSPLQYSVRLGLSDYIGYVVDYENPNEAGQRGVWTTGQRFGEVYGVDVIGIAQNTEDVLTNPHWVKHPRANSEWFIPGDILYADTNGDGVIDEGNGGFWYAQGDRRLLGYNYPRYRYNISLQASWKGFSLSALFDGVGKQTVHSTSRSLVGAFRWVDPYLYDDQGYWRTDNTDAFLPRYYWTINNQVPHVAMPNSRYAFNLAHLRIRNINLSYQLPMSLAGKVGLNNVTFNASVENVGFVYRKQWNKNVDPLQIENNGQMYPPLRTFSFGVRVGI
ncbi:SusC/RagA family TonB-linked outer membrane protein [Echinicola strongylocentroti]|uniref:SusC/RagA family TonB-linked outer membrane protein n=1 Tax=Echinicola strongylocentroti TaxID=1795355 RepID=UPI0013A6A6A6|nr:SusC/RagA family TonB-linked outer membrane protein [Echinicola strongylocentroti]